MSELKKHADFSYCYLLKNTTKSIQRPGNLSQNSSARHARWPRRKKEPPSPFVSSPLQVTRCNYPELRKKKKKFFMPLLWPSPEEKLPSKVSKGPFLSKDSPPPPFSLQKRTLPAFCQKKYLIKHFANNKKLWKSQPKITRGLDKYRFSALEIREMTTGEKLRRDNCCIKIRIKKRGKRSWARGPL